jgi:Na+/H+ antiporter NhaD/arsenite permease-like protein
VIARQITHLGPPIWALFVAGAFASVVTGVLPLGAAETAIASSTPVLVFLFSLFLFAGALEQAGALQHLARWVLGRARDPADLPFVLFVGLGLASAVIVNDALVIIGVPLLVGVAGRLRTDPKPLLLVLAFSVTVGSALTPFGNPQNLLVAVASGLTSPVSIFLRYLALPIGIGLLVGGGYVRRVYGPQMPRTFTGFADGEREAARLFPETGWGPRLREHPVLWIFPGTMLVVATLDVVSAVTHGPPVSVWETALAGAVLLVLLTPARGAVIQRVSWSILILFAALFVVVAGAVGGGVIAALEGVLPIPGPGHPAQALLGVVATSIGGTQIVSNVPWVALQIPLLSHLGYGSGTPVIWVALAAGSTLAGNVTLLGAASNLILVDSAERLGIRIGLGAFIRHGLPIAAITLSVLVACLWFGL